MKNYREVADIVLERRNAYQKTQKHRRSIVMRTAAGTGGLCLAVLLGLGLYHGSPVGQRTDRISPAGRAVPEESSSNGLAAAESGMGFSAENSTAALPDSDSPDTSVPAAPRETAACGSDLIPISYSSLSLPQGQVKPDIISEYAADNQASAGDILPFSEELLSESCAIFEGRITDMYLKHYSYDTYSDKFGPREVYHNRCSSVVYELTVDKVWYGDESLAGSSILIEDDIYLIDTYFSLKIGCSYVIPVCDAGEEKGICGEYAGGDLTRDSRYTSLYPYHPQIQVTSDGNYIVTSDWETLCSGDAPHILTLPADADSIAKTLIEYHPEPPSTEEGLITTEWRTLLVSAYDAIFYYDKMRYLEADEFFIRLNRLIHRLP